ncbi:DNA-binding domain-containing protein [Hahella aquimaris]|uniref:HvfC/BufC N-terminal domain-containing protein n=1 Tax=Hahella sp. HNIBRBA332 TaxID=3015983 RepID=UPI00273AF1DF|nr:DNA-binding domain-containing protein [Hahella sp. HNIBRBA332]WLQ12572.1 DNA-binding domain-containing protein [Hahella sp. HNIBRBA332]
MSLRDLQLSMLAEIRQQGECVQVKDKANLSARTCVGIYRDSLRETHVRALQTMFPVCQELLGEECFRATSRRYFAEIPSRENSFTEFGAAFVAFLSGFTPLQHIEFLTDVAKLELLIHVAEEADDHVSDDWTQFNDYCAQGLPLQFRLPANATLLQCAYPAHEIWAAHQPGGDLASVELSENGFHLMIWRPEWSARIDSLDAPTFYFLQLIAELSDFEEVCERFAEDFPEVDLGSLLQQCIQTGSIAGFIPLP